MRKYRIKTINKSDTVQYIPQYKDWFFWHDFTYTDRGTTQSPCVYESLDEAKKHIIFNYDVRKAPVKIVSYENYDPSRVIRAKPNNMQIMPGVHKY